VNVPIPATLRLPIAGQVDEDLASDIEKQSVYVSQALYKLRVDLSSSEVELTFRAGADVDALSAKVSRFLHAMVRGYRKIETTVHYTRQRPLPKPYVVDVFGELQKRGWLYEHSRGVVSLAGPALRLLEYIDASFEARYRAAFDPECRRFPTLVSPKLLSRCGYFESHPNALSLVSHLVDDFDEIEAFRVANKAHEDGMYIAESQAFSLPKRCLNPAACFPCYEAIAGQRVSEEGCTYTWMGPVFRHESSNLRGLDRLWEFNVRELVFIGNEAFNLSMRQRAMGCIQAIVTEWDLDARIETATDPFFATVNSAKAFWQKSMDVKYELKLPLAPVEDGKPRWLAAGSINLHGQFFGSRFDIRDAQDQPAHTGCIGFGLERWVLALFSKHGFAPDDWPQVLRSVFRTSELSPASASAKAPIRSAAPIPCTRED